MKNISSRKFNNKGAALIAVMIAVVFVSIIATTLLALSLNNYQMKTVSNSSKENFYETEQDINIVTAQIRNEAKAATGDGADAVMAKISDDGTHASAAKICKLVYPFATTNMVTDSTGTYTFGVSSDPILVEQKSGGKKVTIKGVTVTHTDNQDYRNSIRTDIELYIQQATAGSAVSGVGDCSFLLDNSFYIDGGSGTRVNIFGNCIFGRYKIVNGKSEPYTIPFSSNHFDYNAVNNSTYDNPACTMLLKNYSVVNVLGDYTVVLGDVYVGDNAVLNVHKGNFTVYGNIYVGNGGSFICSGNLHFGNGGGLYYFPSNNGNCTQVTSTSLTNKKYGNIYIGGNMDSLSATDYANIRTKLKLDDSDPDNDGVLPGILVKSNALSPAGYIYNFKASGQDFSKSYFKFNGKLYSVDIAQGDLNGTYQQKLLIVPASVNNGYTNITETISDCTIISKKPVKVYETHNVNVSQLGGETFNRFLTDSNLKMTAQQDSDSTSKTAVINSFFDTNCNSFVQTIFSISIGSGGGAPSGVSDTAVGFKNWFKQ